MDTRLEVLKSLEKALKMIDKDVRFGLFVSYFARLDDLDYISDEEFKRIVDDYIDVNTGCGSLEITPGESEFEFYDHAIHDITKEKERIAYERYKATDESGKIDFNLAERLSWYEFLCRFPDIYGHASDLGESAFGGWSVINHVTRFYADLPQRYVPMYVVARKGDRHTCIITNSAKIPDALELFDFITSGWCLHYYPIIDGRQQSLKVEADEWFAIVFDKEGLIRPQCYPQLVYFGMAVRPDKKEYEIYETGQAIEVFHELFAKCDEIINHV